MKYALVTGATSGLGNEVAKTLSKKRMVCICVRQK